MSSWAWISVFSVDCKQDYIINVTFRLHDVVIPDVVKSDDRSVRNAFNPKVRLSDPFIKTERTVKWFIFVRSPGTFNSWWYYIALDLSVGVISSVDRSYLKDISLWKFHSTMLEVMTKVSTIDGFNFELLIFLFLLLRESRVWRNFHRTLSLTCR